MDAPHWGRDTLGEVVPIEVTIDAEDLEDAGSRMMTYTEKASAKYESMHNALQLVVDELNQGQRKKIVKNKEVKELLDFYKVDYKGQALSA